MSNAGALKIRMLRLCFDNRFIIAPLAGVAPRKQSTALREASRIKQVFDSESRAYLVEYVMCMARGRG